MQSQAPIGIFDSGVGGTSIWKEIIHLLPHEHTIYLADSAHAPYGAQSKERIIALCKKNTERLLEMGCKLIVVACNTATTNAISILRDTYSVPFIGIEPAIKPAALKSQTHTVGILATKGTLNSQLFANTSSQFTDTTKIIEVIGEGLVPLIEQNKMDSPSMQQLLERFLAPLLAQKIDYLVLGCSHYPYLIPQLKKILPPHVNIIDSGEAVARQTLRILEENELQNNSKAKPTHRLYSNGDPLLLETIVKQSGWDVHAFAKAYFDKLDF